MIEIIAVLVIIGILASVALPKYMGLQKDARMSAVKGMQGAMNGAIHITHSKAIVYGQTGAIGTINCDGKVIDLQYGFPKNVTALKDTISLNEGFTIDGETYTKDGAPVPENCSVSYTAPTATGGSPVLTVKDDGC